MGIMDKIKGVVNKTTGGQHSAPTTAPAPDATVQAPDPAPSSGPITETPTGSDASEAPVEPTSEA